MTEFVSAPLMTCINVTDYCNLKCKYCYAHNENRIFMPTEKILELVFDLHSQGVWQIVLGGGEPFFHPDIIQIIGEVLAKNIDIGVISNGTVLTDQHIHGLRRLTQKHVGLLNIQVSIDSVDPAVNDQLRERGVRVLATIERMIDAELPISLGTVIHKFSVESAHEIIKKYYPQVKKFHFMQLMPSYSIKQLDKDYNADASAVAELMGKLRSYEQRYNDIIISVPDLSRVVGDKQLPTLDCDGCTAAVTRMDVNANGDLLACNIADTSVIGNIHSQSVEEVWRSAAAATYRHDKLPICMKDYFLKWKEGAAIFSGDP